MNRLEESLCLLYDELQNSMFKCKTIHLRYKMKPEHIVFLQNQAVLTIYAKWEGFLKESLKTYLEEINSKNIKIHNLHEYYLAYQLDKIIEFKKPKTETKTIHKISAQLLNSLNSNCNVKIHTTVHTESNANLKITNNILKKLNLEPINQNHSKELDTLLLFRNRIAHGDYSIPVTQNELNIFTLLIQNISSELIISIISGYDNKVYLNPPLT